MHATSMNPFLAETVENYEVVFPVVTYPEGKKVSWRDLARVLLFCTDIIIVSE